MYIQTRYITKEPSRNFCLNLHVKNKRPSFEYVSHSFAVKFELIIRFCEKNNFTKYMNINVLAFSQSMGLLSE